MTEANAKESTTIDYFVDEAGDPTLFDAKGRIIVGCEGCSRFFILGKLDVNDPPGLCRQLNELRARLLADPYFKGVPSMQPAERKTAVAFHAKDDLPEVRWAVFQLLARQNARFYAVVRDKLEVVAYVKQQNQRDPSYHYNENELYDTLVSELFSKFRRMADRMHICFARRGARNRSAALRVALETASRQFERDFGFANPCQPEISDGTPATHPCLQAVDYYMWALQRFYERNEERYIELIWPQVGEIHDLDFVENNRCGVFYRKDKPLNLAAREAQKRSRGI
jgi:hypothetical protein